MSKNKHNAADEGGKEDQAKKIENDRLTQLEDLRFLLSHGQGVRFFKRLFDEAHMFHTSFTGNSATFFKEGERNLALRIFNDIAEAAPNKVAELIMRED